MASICGVFEKECVLIAHILRLGEQNMHQRIRLSTSAHQNHFTALDLPVYFQLV